MKKSKYLFFVFCFINKNTLLTSYYLLKIILLIGYFDLDLNNKVK